MLQGDEARSTVKVFGVSVAKTLVPPEECISMNCLISGRIINAVI